MLGGRKEGEAFTGLMSQGWGCGPGKDLSGSWGSRDSEG